jgi:hypothetical protein
MQKKLNVASISDELRGGSVFFGGQQQQEPTPLPPSPLPPPEPEIPTPPKPIEANVRTDEQENERPIVQTTDRTDEQMNERSDEQPVERTKVRNAFDIFNDQIFSLREIAIQRSKSQGKRVTLGDLVQEALDKFIQGE